MNPLISLVIPVYNVEKYLDKCMESVLAQTYDNFEVILVDDGSTDNSGKMCDEYAKRDSRVIVYHKPNGGLSDARNFGVEHCNADLVSFIDSDDYVTEDYLEYLWYLMKKYNSDISFAKKAQQFENNDPRIDANTPYDRILTTTDALHDFCVNATSACARLYKKQMLRLHLFPKGKLYEDLATVYKILADCKSAACGSKDIYIQVTRQGSIQHSGMNQNQLDIFTAAGNLYNFIIDNYPELQSDASVRCMIAVGGLLDRVFTYCEAKDRRQYFSLAKDFAKPHIKDTLANKHSTLSNKFSCIAINMGYIPYKIFWKAKQSLKKSLRRA